MDDLQSLHARAVRPLEGKSATPEGLDGEIRGSWGSAIIRMRDMGLLTYRIRLDH